MAHSFAWSAMIWLSATVALGSGCSRSECVSERQIATARGVVSECVTAQDTQVVAAVERRLAKEIPGATGAIHVSAISGVATLTGEVQDEERKHRAEKLAYTVDGVERVENELRVALPPQNPRAMEP